MKKFIIFLPLFLLQSCLTEPPVESFSFEFSNTEELLIYLESKGDYINSFDVPSIIDADEVFMNLADYLVIDVRDSITFKNGHIEGAINIVNKDLLNYVKNIDSTSFKKIVLVSQAGQSSAYYTSLLRLAGFNNVFSMQFGMAYWNQHFSEIWVNKLLTIGSPLLTVTEFPKPEISSLPEVKMEKSGSIQERLEKRISILFEEGFSESNFFGIGPSISVDGLFMDINDYFIICYGLYELYFSKGYGVSHPLNAVNYYPPPIFCELRSTKYLQTLPTDKPIAIYDTNGELSAFTVAYLRVLGYNAKSVLFGASNMLYGPLSGIYTLSPSLFNVDSINDYPFVTDN